jgi:hypothetical protein
VSESIDDKFEKWRKGKMIDAIAAALAERDRRIRLEARLETLDEWLRFATSKGWDGAVVITKRDFEKFCTTHIATPPAAEKEKHDGR